MSTKMQLYPTLSKGGVLLSTAGAHQLVILPTKAYGPHASYKTQIGLETILSILN